MNLIVEELIIFNYNLSHEEDDAVLNYLNEKWDVGLKSADTPLIYDSKNHCFFEKEFENNI